MSYFTEEEREAIMRYEHGEDYLEAYFNVEYHMLISITRALEFYCEYLRLSVSESYRNIVLDPNLPEPKMDMDHLEVMWTTYEKFRKDLVALHDREEYKLMPHIFVEYKPGMVREPNNSLGIILTGDVDFAIARATKDLAGESSEYAKFYQMYIRNFTDKYWADIKELVDRYNKIYDEAMAALDSDKKEDCSQ